MTLQQTVIDDLRAKAISPSGNFIANRFVPALDGREQEVVSPIDGRVLTTIAASTAQDVDAAVDVARRAFESGVWSRMPPNKRKRILLRWAELIERDALEIAVLGVRDNGTDIATALKGEPLSAAATIRFYAEAIDKRSGEVTPTDSGVVSLVTKEPVGVIGIIIPWNFPLMIGAWKIAPALAAGNTVVVKPSEDASLSTLRIAQLAAEAGLPDGVLNVVTGRGSIAGAALGLHMDVDVLAFTGSGTVGRHLLGYAAQSNLKRVYLELGGKSPNLVFADAPDLDRAARETVQSIFRNNGQVCVAASRLAVEASVYDDFMALVRHHAEALRVGDPLDLASTTGALANAAQLAKTRAAVAAATAGGATLFSGGKMLQPVGGGFYHQPTILTDVVATMDVVQEEVFGPVLAARSFAGEEEAIKIANETVYGLSSVVWSRDISRVHRVASAIKAGTVMVNTYSGADLTSPMGGVKQSGNGVDRSLHAFDKFETLKAVWIRL